MMADKLCYNKAVNLVIVGAADSCYRHSSRLASLEGLGARSERLLPSGDNGPGSSCVIHQDSAQVSD